MNQLKREKINIAKGKTENSVADTRPHFEEQVLLSRFEKEAIEARKRREAREFEKRRRATNNNRG